MDKLLWNNVHLNLHTVAYAIYASCKYLLLFLLWLIYALQSLLYILWSREHQGICVRPRWHKIRPPNVLRMNDIRCANYTLCIYPVQIRIKEIINFVQYDTFNACVYLPSVQSTVCLIEHAALASIVHKLKPKRYREDLRGPAQGRHVNSWSVPYHWTEHHERTVLSWTVYPL